MKTRIANGWFYVYKKGFSHPWAEAHRNGHRFALKPEVVVRVFEDVPELQTACPDFWLWNKRWTERLLRSTAIKAKSPDEINIPHNFKMTPMGHQKVALAFSLNIPAAGLLLEQGTGKTYVALLNAEIRQRAGRVKKPLVIAPASVMQTGWEEDCHKFTDMNPIILHEDVRMKSWFCPLCKKSYSSISDSHAKQHYKALRELLAGEAQKLRRKDITADHYTSVFPESKDVLYENEIYRTMSVEDRMSIEGDNIWITSPDMAKKHLKAILDAGFDMVILDESTMIKAPSTERSKAIHKIGDRSKYRLILSGTPITNHLEDAWSQARFLDGSLGPVFGRFVDKYFWTHSKFHYIRNPIAGAEDRVRDMLKDRCIRFTKKECLDLPERTFLMRDVKMTKKASKMYRSMSEDLFALLESGEEVVASTVMNRVQKLQQITNGFLIDEEDTLVIDKIPPKLREVRRILDELDSSQKVIIWCVYKQDIQNLMEHLSDYNPVLLKTQGILDRIDKFRNDDACRVAISNPKSCKFGLTLNNSNVTVYYSMSYSVEDYLQSLDRNHRAGQTLPVTVYHLMGSPVDWMIYEAVKNNVDFGQSIVNHADFKALVSI